MYALVTITAVYIILGAMVPLPLHKLLTDPQCLAFSYSVLLQSFFPSLVQIGVHLLRWAPDAVTGGCQQPPWGGAGYARLPTDQETRILRNYDRDIFT